MVTSVCCRGRREVVGYLKRKKSCYEERRVQLRFVDSRRTTNEQLEHLHILTVAF